MTEPGDEEMAEVGPDLARQAAVELYGPEAVDAVGAAFDAVCMAQFVIDNRTSRRKSRSRSRRLPPSGGAVSRLTEDHGGVARVEATGPWRRSRR